VARCLIIGCGCRGLSLANELRGRGHALRGTTRRPERLAALEEAGVEPVLGDPDRIATIAPAFAQVSVVCVLLGSASGTEEQLRALHGTRLEMMLTKMLDTTIHGVVFEAAGAVGIELLGGGAGRVRETCEGSRIPYALLDADPADATAWLNGAVAAVDQVL
jgi:3-hydroxyisobutyrate dehydrogenase-like beta-hydroxyacid dehydrogenase